MDPTGSNRKALNGSTMGQKMLCVRQSECHIDERPATQIFICNFFIVFILVDYGLMKIQNQMKHYPMLIEFYRKIQVKHRINHHHIKIHTFVNIKQMILNNVQLFVIFVQIFLIFFIHYMLIHHKQKVNLLVFIYQMNKF
jgi:hypothetical protein